MGKGTGKRWCAPTTLVVVLAAVGTVTCSGGTTPTEDADASRNTWRSFSSSCSAEDPGNASISCHGVRIVRRVVQQLLEKSAGSPNFEIASGVSLIEPPNGGGAPRRARKLGGFGPMGPVLEFLEGRELRVKLLSMFPENLEDALKESLPSVGTGRGKGGGFGGGKGGGGGIILMGLMMGKMMSALGFGALALLAMKALMVSALALMLSLIVAAKKLSGGHDDGGGHHVVYAQEVGGHHHRKRRSTSPEEEEAEELSFSPYRGYVDFGASVFAS